MRKKGFHDIGKSLEELKDALKKWTVGTEGALVFTTDFEASEGRKEVQIAMGRIGRRAEGKSRREVEEMLRDELARRGQ